MKIKTLTFKCGCGSPLCGTLGIDKIQKDWLDIYFIPYGKKKAVAGVVVQSKDYQKLKKLLT